MPASLHNSLIVLAHQLVQSVPRPLRSALDAWSQRVARKRALQRQLAWQRSKAAAAGTPAPQAYHLKPWRD